MIFKLIPNLMWHYVGVFGLVDQENKSKLTLLGISCFFVLVKIVSTYFTASKQVFLLHVSNGGLLQALWRWRNLSKENHEADEKTSVT